MKKQKNQEPITKAILTEVITGAFKEYDKKIDKKFDNINKQFNDLTIILNQNFDDIAQKLDDIEETVDISERRTRNTKDDLERYKVLHAKEHDKIEASFTKLGLRY